MQTKKVSEKFPIDRIFPKVSVDGHLDEVLTVLQQDQVYLNPQPKELMLLNHV